MARTDLFSFGAVLYEMAPALFLSAAKPRHPFSTQFLTVRRSAAVRLNPEIPADGQDIAEYAVVVAVILLIVVGTLRLIGSNAKHRFF